MRAILALMLVIAGVSIPDICAASVFSECGSYRVLGDIELEDSRPVLVIFAGSMSETKLKIEPDPNDPGSLDAFRNLMGYRGRRVAMNGVIKEPVDGYRGKIELKSVIPVLAIGFSGNAGEEYNVIAKAECRAGGK